MGIALQAVTLGLFIGALIPPSIAEDTTHLVVIFFVQAVFYSAALLVFAVAVRKFPEEEEDVSLPSTPSSTSCDSDFIEISADPMTPSTKTSQLWKIMSRESVLLQLFAFGCVGAVRNAFGAVQSVIFIDAGIDNVHSAYSISFGLLCGVIVGIACGAGVRNDKMLDRMIAACLLICVSCFSAITLFTILDGIGMMASFVLLVSAVFHVTSYAFQGLAILSLIESTSPLNASTGATFLLFIQTGVGAMLIPVLLYKSALCITTCLLWISLVTWIGSRLRHNRSSVEVDDEKFKSELGRVSMVAVAAMV